MNKIRESLRHNNYRLGLNQLSDVVNELADEIDNHSSGDAKTVKYTDNKGIDANNVQDAIDNVVDELVGAGQAISEVPIAVLKLLFEADGAEYNDGTMKEKTQLNQFIWSSGDYESNGKIYRNDFYGEVVERVPGCWTLNGIGDITTEEMAKIHSKGRLIIESPYILYCSQGNLNSEDSNHIRTSLQGSTYSVSTMNNSFLRNYFIEKLMICNTQQFIVSQSFTSTFRYARKLSTIYNAIDVKSIKNFSNSFEDCDSLKYVRLKSLAVSISFKGSPNLSEVSLKYIIENEAATSNITITLEQQAYDRAMNDAGVLSALQAHPSVSLAV